ncbi:hypothetical protein FOCC_FOCC005729, partial [Frankliniella occidentalis]
QVLRGDHPAVPDPQGHVPRRRPVRPGQRRAAAAQVRHLPLQGGRQDPQEADGARVQRDLGRGPVRRHRRRLLQAQHRDGGAGGVRRLLQRGPRRAPGWRRARAPAPRHRLAGPLAPQAAAVRVPLALPPRPSRADGVVPSVPTLFCNMMSSARVTLVIAAPSVVFEETHPGGAPANDFFFGSRP